jgi:hypothetical protein
VASDVTVSGLFINGNVLTGDYLYADQDADIEENSVFQWYRADDASGTNNEAILGATDLAYQLESADISKYLRFGVVPEATSGSTPGVVNFSGWFGPVLSADAPLASASGTLVEGSLTTDVVTLTLTNTTFTTSSLTSGVLTLNNAPSGLQVDAVNWVSATEATVSFTYDATDFDDTIEDFSITISGSVLASSSSLTTNDLTITASLEVLEVNGTLAFGEVCIGAVSEAQTFQVSGTDLKAGTIAVAATFGFLFSEDEAGPYTESLELSHSGGDLAPVNVYVTFSPTFSDNYNNDIEVTSFGAPSQNQSVAAQGVNLPSVVSAPTDTSVTQNSASLGGTLSEIGCSAVVERGIYYSTTNGFANGSGTKVSEANGPYDLEAFSLAVNGLATGTTYYYKAFVRSADDTSFYSIQGTFVTLPIAAPTAVTATEEGDTSFLANWEAVAGAVGYALDVSTFETFGSSVVTPNQTLLNNTGSVTLPGWSQTNVTVSSGALSMITATSQLTSAAFNTTSYIGVTLNFDMRTFGGVTGDSNQVHIFISTDNGVTWSSLGIRTAAGSSLNPVASFSLASLIPEELVWIIF